MNRDALGGVVEKVYKAHDYILDNEVREVLLDTSQHKLLVAPAGGTKTTLTQLMVNLRKLEVMVKGIKHNAKATSPLDRIPSTISSSKILCIVYNRHNASDIDTVHAKFYNTLSSSLRLTSPSPADRNYVEPGVVATTLHSYCIKIIEDNLKVLKLRSFKLSKEEIIHANFNRIVSTVMENSSIKVTGPLITEIKALYELYVGLKLYDTPVEKPLTDNIQFEIALQSVHVPAKYLREIFEKYDKRKRTLKIFEYSDMLRLADQILSIDELRESYSTYFDTIVADEVQDFTPLMFSIYKNLIGPNTITITVGDPDQSIYSFLGAMPDAINRFESFMGIKVKRFDLTTNRRCRMDTMPYALNVINSIPGRAKRMIRTNKMEGKLFRHEYKDVSEQIALIDKILKSNISGNTGILFRTKNESILLSRYLYQQNIQANFINAKHCMEHRIYTMFLDLLNECFISKSQRGLTMLHRILPFNKKKLEEFFDFDEQSKVSKTCPTSQLWGNLDFTPLYANSPKFFSIDEQVKFVQEVARESASITASDCIPKLLDMFYYNFFSHLTEAQDDPYSEIILQWAKEDLGVGYTLRVAVENLQKNISRYMSSGRKVGKLNICTIHGTKGLEFNHVILNLEAENVGAGQNLSSQAKQFQDNEENRLMYVAATRQIDTLNVLCSSTFPHRLADESYFKVEKPEIVEAKFNNVAPTNLLEDQLLKAPTRPRSSARRSMLLED